MEIKIWESGKASELVFWKHWLKRKVDYCESVRRLGFMFDFMIGDKNKVKIANLGSGPVSLIGNVRRDKKVKIVSSDILADEYKKLCKELNIKIPYPVEKQDMTKLTYKANSFDIVFCSNALDHCQSPKKALKQMLRICKSGGWIYLWHYAHEGKRHAYRNFHQWNLDDTDNGDCKIWTKANNKTDTFLLSDIYPGFTTKIRPSGKVHIITSYVQKR